MTASWFSVWLRASIRSSYSFENRGRGVTMLVTSMPCAFSTLLRRVFARSSACAKLVGFDTLIVDSRPNSSRRIDRAYGSIHV